MDIPIVNDPHHTMFASDIFFTSPNSFFSLFSLFLYIPDPKFRCAGLTNAVCDTYRSFRSTYGVCSIPKVLTFVSV